QYQTPNPHSYLSGSYFRLSLLAFSGFGGGFAAAETRKELRHTARSGLGWGCAKEKDARNTSSSQPKLYYTITDSCKISLIQSIYQSTIYFILYNKPNHKYAH
ncbi:hypothetical protein, partial [Chryseobacterium cheonjiense]|uniref:hypothetical protein n=1 Tax=Chryseobacterium cheonjiense TaxID=2728845 RepID=UPI001E2E4D22